MKILLPVLLGVILNLFLVSSVKAEDPLRVCNPACPAGQYCFNNVCQVSTCSDLINQDCALTANGVTYKDGSGFKTCQQEMDPEAETCHIKEPDCSNTTCLPRCNPDRNITSCKGDLLYATSECDQKFGDSAGVLKEDCTTRNNSESDWHCKETAGKAQCQREYQVDINTVPAPSENSIYLGEKYIVDIHGTNSCKSAVFSPETLGKTGNDGFADTDQFKQNCKIEFMGCLCSGDKPCRWQATCTPTKMSKNNSDNFGFTFEAKGINIDSESFGNKCKGETKYTVGARTCNLSQDKPPTDPGGLKDNNNLIGRTLNSTYTVTNAFNQALLPDELNQEIGQGTTEGMPDIGVQTGFFQFLEGLQDLACSASSWLFNSFSFCNVKVDLASEKTQHFVKAAGTLVNTERPSEVVPTPMKKSCYLEDQKGTTQGNQNLDDLSTSLGVDNSVYGLGMPDFSSDVNLDKTGSNLSIKQQVIQQDDRNPGIKCQEELYYQANFPEGIKPLYKVPDGAVVSSCINDSN